MKKYTPKYRPAGFATLPPVWWEFVEAPSYLTARGDLPRSNYRHGVITCDRDLTADEIEAYELQEVVI